MLNKIRINSAITELHVTNDGLEVEKIFSSQGAAKFLIGVQHFPIILKIPFLLQDCNFFYGAIRYPSATKGGVLDSLLSRKTIKLGCLRNFYSAMYHGNEQSLLGIADTLHKRICEMYIFIVIILIILF